MGKPPLLAPAQSRPCTLPGRDLEFPDVILQSPSRLEECSDAELIQRHMDGDSEAFGTLLRRYEGELYGFLRRFTGNAALAEDVFQDTFLQVHLSAGMFDPTRNFRPWLFTVASNKARDALRKRKRKSAAPLDASPASLETEGTYADLMPSDVPPPSEDLLNQEQRAAVQTIVDSLPEPLRLVLILSYFQSLPYKEIADILEIPLGTVKSRLHAAVQQFGEKWKASQNNPGRDT